MAHMEGKVSTEGSSLASTSTMDKIRIAGLTKLFRTGRTSVTALAEVNLSVPEGQFLCVVGPSGCGKTTMLRIMGGLETPTTGEVAVSRRNKDKPINSMIFQEHAIFPWMTVRDNVAYGLRMRGVPRGEAMDRAGDYVRKVGLAKFSKAYPHQLSGGMKQRVGLARALSMSPDSFFMDEPFASLDAQMRELMQEELLRIWSQFKTTVVFVTHGIDEAIYLSDRVIVMSARPGRVKLEMPIPFPRPRHGVRAAPEFARLREELWEILKGEIQYGRMRGTSDGG